MQNRFIWVEFEPRIPQYADVADDMYNPLRPKLMDRSIPFMPLVNFLYLGTWLASEEKVRGHWSVWEMEGPRPHRRKSLWSTSEVKASMVSRRAGSVDDWSSSYDVHKKIPC